MMPKCLCLLVLAASFSLAHAQAAAPPSTSASGPVRIKLTNEYVVDLNFGPLGEGERHGTDTAEGVLEMSEGKYVGTVTAQVDSWQTLAGLVGSCGPGHYKQSQELDAVGTLVSDFNSNVQTVTFNRETSTGKEGEYLFLTFTPKTPIPLPTRDGNGQLVVSCHTLIERPQGAPFLPLNDSRWTTDSAGYIIALPSTGVLNYTDNTIAGGQGSALSPLFNAYKGIWKIQVERLP
jgi:hypothetical protein